MPSSARPRGRQVNVYQLVALLLAFVLVSGVGGVLAAGFVIPLAAGANTVTDTSVQVFEELPEDLEPGPLAQQSRMYANDGKTLLARFWTENRLVVPLDKVSDDMKNAVIAIEDRRFYEHGGVDLEGIMRAAVNNFGGNNQQGGSTLTQQYVKNVLIEQAVRADDPIGVLEAREDSVARKAREAKLAISLEQRMTKDEILEGYLNIAQFGTGVYGVETAARHYFSTSAAKLTPVQAATIAGVTKGPSEYDPLVNPELSEKRRNLVLDAMWAQHYITTEERDEAKALSLEETLDVQELRLGCQAAQGAAFFCDYVTKVIVNEPAFGETQDERRALLYRGGLRITTTLDRPMQRAAERESQAAVPADDPSGLENVIVSVEPGTGKILAMAQNRPYDPTDDPAPGSTAVNYAADQTHGSSRGFSPGSTWKPFLLAEWLNQGKTLYETVNSNQRGWHNSDFDFCGAWVANEPTPWTPGNSDGRNAQGNISVLEATYNSINTAYVPMESQLRLCDVKATAERIGVRPSITSEQEGGIKMVPSMVIGTQNSSPLQLAAAYATFASGGTYCEPIAITKVLDAQGKEIPVPGSDCDTNALSSSVANTVTYALERVMTHGSGRSAALSGRPSAGKTGTSQANRHTWFIGYTPQVATAVWIGNAEEDVEMANMTINGVWQSRWFGSTLAAPTWKRYMDAVHEELPVQSFGSPDWSKINAPAPPPPPPGSGGDDSARENGNRGGSEGRGGSGGGGSTGGDSGNGGGGSGGGDSGNGGDSGGGGGNGNGGGGNGGGDSGNGGGGDGGED